jgi:hypothetical protein
LTGWLRSDPADGTPVRVSEPNVSIPLPENTRASALLAACEDILDQFERKRGFLYPVSVDLSGKGIVFDANGTRREAPNVCWLAGATLQHHVIYVMTQSDAWLPYTLKAEPQPEVFKLNAPRLEAALHAIQQRLAVEPASESETRYAIINGFQLSNHKYADGEIAEVI